MTENNSDNSSPTISNKINEQLEEISFSLNNETRYNLVSTLTKVKKQRQLHRMASQYYERMNSLISLPAIAISGAASIYSFAYPSDGCDPNIFVNKIIAGSLSALNTVLFSMANFLKFQAKAESHFIAAEEYDNLVTMINFEIRFPNEDIQNFANKIEKKVLEIKKSCRYFPPEHIIKRFQQEHPDMKDSLSI